MTDQAPRRPGLITRIALVLLILSTTIGCDRATKVVAESALAGRGRLSYLSDVFRLELVRNTGAFLSLGARLQEPLRTLLLEGFVGLLVTGLLVIALVRGRTRFQVVALALVAGGGLGNLWDRLETGAVTDFMNLGLGQVVRTGIFNVADLAIVAGVVMMLLVKPPPPEPVAPSPSPPGTA